MRPSLLWTSCISVLLLLSTASPGLYGQQTARPEILAELREISKKNEIPRIAFNESRNESDVYIRIYLVGDIDLDLEGKDTVGAFFGFANPGPKLVEPKSVAFGIYTTSPDRKKYSAEHEVSIWVDGTIVCAANPRIVDDWTTGKTMKSFEDIAIPYGDFLKLLSGKTVTFKIGPTTQVLQPNAVRALRALNDTISRQ